MHNLFIVRSPNEKETWRRIRVAVWAYAYEFMNHSIVSDERFDSEARKVDLSVSTGRPEMDDWFRSNFNPDTGMWIHNHPELNKIKKIYERFFK